MEVIRLKRKSSFFIKTAVILLLVFCLLFGFLLWFQNKYKIDMENDVKVFIVGESNRYSEEQIRDFVLDSFWDQYYIFVEWKAKYLKEEETLPFLERIQVEVEDGQIRITAYEKRPIGCLLEMGNYLYFDKDGVIVSSREENVEDLPVVTGLTYQRVTLYETFETENEDVFLTVLAIVQLLEKHEVEAEEIHFNHDRSVVLRCDGNIVSLGTRDAYDEPIAALRGILASIAEEGSERYELNMEAYDADHTDVVGTVIPGEDKEGDGAFEPSDESEERPDEPETS